MRVVIVGGTGNISTSIVPLLLEASHEVTLYNRGQSGSVPDGVRVIQGDRNQRAEFEATMQREKFDVAMDMVCFSREDAESNLRAFRDVQQFIPCSSVVTYGVNFRWMPVTEDHAVNPTTDYARGKAEADAVYMAAYYATGFPVTIMKPSTTHGPRQGLTRQIAWDFSWIDRVRKGKPIVVCGDGLALHQYLHVDDAALGFAGVVGKAHCIGQTYHVVDRGYTTWADYHRTLMCIVGQEVELVGVPLAELVALNVPAVGICKEIFAHNVVYSGEKLFRDVPEFRPQYTLESAMRHILEAMDAAGRIPDSDAIEWEDQIIAAQRGVRNITMTV